MIVILTISFACASMIALSAYLQVDASWWKGIAATIALFIGGIAVIWLLQSSDGFDATSPAAFLGFGLWLCALMVGLGVLAALLLRRWVKPAKVVTMTFGISFVLCSGGLILASFT
ncbi:hypothetical protein ATO10_13659 [Actibacterium atlanticum]|uniref:Uncharacterized protein n=1 Tax=Actibacterium atlanticum TaxID=1461693 RepID=A0A058ZKD7_9RHOB|nr:hypothetical protein [Actibacterium atlanticum]KCV81231.1 hypothetical protein ATO10_13659 [Actibacterium atlanticum]